jgi:hypothetical protein
VIKCIKNRHNLSSKCLILGLFFIGSALAQDWQSLGPGPLLYGQSEGMPDTPVIGAIHGIATHPTNENIIYVATVNGGVWKTSNAMDLSPDWMPLTDNQNSLSMTDIVFDFSDVSFQTLVASFGRKSSLGSVGGSREGLIKTIDGGNTWFPVNGMSGKNIINVYANGSTFVTAVDVADSYTCGNIGIFKSTNGGTNWSHTMNLGNTTGMVVDPHDNSILYAGVNTYGGVCSPGAVSGIYKSIDSGSSWIKVSDIAMDTVVGSDTCHYKISVGSTSDIVFAGMACQGKLAGVFRSDNGASTWTAMDIPETNESGTMEGIHPGGQGGLHFSLVADPSNNNIVYVGGDRQPASGTSPSFPNSIGANTYSGRLFRGDASQSPGFQWAPLTHSGTASNSSPHADSRDMQFDFQGNLLESDDGGIYRRTNPTNSSGDWVSINGNLRVTEQHDMAFDTTSNITLSGNQDNGTSRQDTFNSGSWSVISGGDGGDVVVDTLSLSGVSQSIRYVSFQNLQVLRRITYDNNNNFISIDYPSLIVLNGGDPISAQFVTPLSINNLNGNRLIIGAGNSVYESLDKGDTVTEVGPGIFTVGTGRNNIAYGAAGNEDILYIGGCQGSCYDGSDGSDGVFVRTVSNGSLNHVFTPNDLIQGVIVNPSDPTEAFIIENLRVLHTINTGANWTDITGSLSNFGRFRSIEFLTDSNGSDNGVAVGADKGVYISKESTNYSSWSVLGTNMPNALVYELMYHSDNDKLIVGTMGRGSFVLSGVLNDLIFMNGFE